MVSKKNYMHNKAIVVCLVTLLTAINFTTNSYGQTTKKYFFLGYGAEKKLCSNQEIFKQEVKQMESNEAAEFLATYRKLVVQSRQYDWPTITYFNEDQFVLVYSMTVTKYKNTDGYDCSLKTYGHIIAKDYQSAKQILALRQKEWKNVSNLAEILTWPVDLIKN